MENSKSISYENAGFLLRRLQGRVYLMLAVHIVLVTMPVLSWYNYPSKQFASEYQNNTFKAEYYWIGGITLVLFAGVLAIYRWYNKQLLQIRAIEDVYAKRKKYYGVNIYMGVFFGVLALIPIARYFIVGLHFYAFIYLLLIFFIYVPLERPTVARLNRNLLHKGETAKQARREVEEYSKMQNN